MIQETDKKNYDSIFQRLNQENNQHEKSVWIGQKNIYELSEFYKKEIDSIYSSETWKAGFIVRTLFFFLWPLIRKIGVLDIFFKEKNEKKISIEKYLEKKKEEHIMKTREEVFDIEVDSISGRYKHLNILNNAQGVRKINFLIETINFPGVFGGMIGLLHLAQFLAKNKYKVRLIISNRTDFTIEQWKKEINNFPGLELFFDYVECVYVFDRSIPISCTPHDIFIAHGFSQALLAHYASKEVGAYQFVYLIQEYEPLLYPSGLEHLLSKEVLDLPHSAIFSTHLLTDYFKNNSIGVFNYRNVHTQKKCYSIFKNAIHRYKISKDDLKVRKKKRFLFYSRPGRDTARNGFDTGIMALTELLEKKYFSNDEWDFFGIGTIKHSLPLRLTATASMRIFPVLNLSEYTSILPSFDLGLALLYSPHPGLLSLEMVAAGMISVTNSFENKTENELQKISKNIIVGEPTIEGISYALVKALNRVDDIDSRYEESKNMRWSFNWDDSFNDEFLVSIQRFF